MKRNVPMITRRQNRTNNVDKIDVSSMTPEETEEKMTELYQKIDRTWNCLSCDYISTPCDFDKGITV